MSDPVGSGLVADLARPGGNVTGLSLALDAPFVGKWVELLKEVVPKASRVAVLLNPTATRIPFLRNTRDAGKALGVNVEAFEVREANEIDGAFEVMSKKRVDGLIVIPEFFTVRHRAKIVDLAAKSRLPAVYGFSEFVRAGGLMAYGASVPD